MILIHIFSILISFTIVTNLCAIPISIIPSEPIESQKVEQTNGLFEGDIVLPPSRRTRSLVSIGASVRWPNGIVPYEILSGYAAEQEAVIIGVMRRLENYVAIDNIRCVEFRPREVSDPYYIIIKNGTGCSSPVGQNSGSIMNRTVTLQYPGCIDDGRIMHEFLHTLGFYHEQSRPDRDSYVNVISDNIMPDKLGDFTKFNNTVTDTLNTAYDYNSVMHYEKDAFSINGSLTLIPLQANVKIGQRYFLSSTDINSIRGFYGCTGIGTPLTPTTTTMTSTDPSVTTSIYSSILTINSPSYARPNGLATNYYYESIQVTVPMAGNYTFTSNNDLDTYAVVYYPSFNLSNPSANIVIQHDDLAQTNWNFRFGLTFPAPLSVILVVTTYALSVEGPFSVIVTGPSSVSFTRTSGTVTIPTTPVAETITSVTSMTTSLAETPTSTVEITITAAQTTIFTTETPTSTIETTIFTIEPTTSAVETTIYTTETPSSTVETTTPAVETTISTTEKPTSTIEITISTTETSVSTVETTTSAVQTTIPTTVTPVSTIATTISTTETPTSSIATTISTIETVTSTVETTTSAVQTAVSTAETTASTVETTASAVETTISTTEKPTSTMEITISSTEISASTVEITISAVQTTISTTEIATSTVETTTFAVSTTISTTEKPTSTAGTTIFTTEMVTPSIKTAAVTTETRSSMETSASIVETTISTVETTISTMETTGTTAISPTEMTSFITETTTTLFSIETGTPITSDAISNIITTSTTVSTIRTTSLTTMTSSTSGNNDNNKDNRSFGGVIAGSVVGGVLFLTFLCGITIANIFILIYYFQGTPIRSNKTYVRTGFRMNKDMGNRIFQHSSFSGSYFKDGSWHGSDYFTFGFYPQANHVLYGKGKDHIGIFVAKGFFSPRTLRMAFEKRYQTGLENAIKNGNLTTVIQVEWNPMTQNFEGKYYLKEGRKREEQKYIMHIKNRIYRH